MKFLLPLIALVCAAAALVAQTNATASKAQRGDTQILSDFLEAGLTSHTAVYRGNVRVEDPLMKLTCELLSARFVTNNSKLEIESIIAEKNVVVDRLDEKGRNSHATAEKLVYTYKVTGTVTNEIIELSGNPQLTNAQLGRLEGELIIWNKTTDIVNVKAPRTSIKIPGSNSIPSALTLPTGPKN